MKDVPFLPNYGNGKIIVFGRDASVIVSGDGLDEITIAAAELGKGRVVLITHFDYLFNFTQKNTDTRMAQLHVNLKNWVTKNKYTSNDNLAAA